MVVTYYIKLFCTGSDRHNGILMSLLLLVAETKNFLSDILFQSEHTELPCEPYNTETRVTYRFAPFYLQWRAVYFIFTKFNSQWNGFFRVFFESLLILFMLVLCSKQVGFWVALFQKDNFSIVWCLEPLVQDRL